MKSTDPTLQSRTIAVLIATLVVVTTVTMPVVAIDDGEDAASGEVSVTAEPPHPDIEEIRLIGDSDTDRTESGVVTPGEQYVLELDLETDHGLNNALEQLEIGLYRGEGVEDTPGDISQEGVYTIDVTYDDHGDATATSESGPDPDLSVTATAVDLDASSDTAEITIDFPKQMLPSANSANDAINAQTWVVQASAINEDVLDEEEPQSVTDTFDVSVMLDATLQSGEVAMGGGALPGTDNVPLSSDDGETVELEAVGNVDIQIGMDLDHLEHDAGDELHTIGANNVHVLAGDGFDANDYDHPDVQQLGDAPVNLIQDGSPVVAASGETIPIRMWVDIPEGTPPGDYTGEFSVVVAEDTGSTN